MSLDCCARPAIVYPRVDPDAAHRPTGSAPLRFAQDDTKGGQARFQGSTFVQLKFDYTVPENEILSVSKTVNLTNIMERLGWRADKPAFRTRLLFDCNSVMLSPRMRFYLFSKQFNLTNIVERAGWRYRRACGSYCLVSVPQIGGIKL